MADSSAPCRLASLPLELRSLIAKHLDDTALIALRNCRNRAIRDGVDYEFQIQFFAVRHCLTKPRSIQRLEAIARSRLAASVITINIYLHFDLPSSVVTRDVIELAGSARSCKGPRKCLNILYRKLVEIFRRTLRLRCLAIRGTEQSLAGMYNAINYSILFETIVYHGITPVAGHGPLAHGHIQGYAPPHALLHSIFTAIATAKVQLVSFHLVEFSFFPQRTWVVPTLDFLHAIVVHPYMRHLTTLTLELDMFQTVPAQASESLVQILRNNPGLRDLKLYLRPTFSTPNSNQANRDVCRPLLHVLAFHSPIRLRFLYLNGLYADSVATLDSLVRRHSATLRTLVLDDTNFNRPNRMRPFFQSLADSQLEYLAMRSFDVNGIYELRFAHYHEELVEVDSPEEDSPGDDSVADDSENGWVLFDQIVDDEHTWLEIDVRGADADKSLIKDVMSALVEQIDCGAIFEG